MKIKPVKKGPEKIVMKTKPNANRNEMLLEEWWKADNEAQLASQICSTAAYLKTNQQFRTRQLAVSVRLYCGLPIYSYAGSNSSKMNQTKSLPNDKHTFNVVRSCTDTLVSRLSQNQPQPKFLTDNADYHKRHLAQELNQFCLGEFHQTKAYEKSVKMLRDALLMGTGALKVYEGEDNKVCIDRVLPTDIFVDDNDALNGTPQQLLQLKLMDRSKLIAMMPKDAKMIAQIPNSYPDNAPESGRTISDQVMVVEGWRLASCDDPEAPGYIPGRHVIATMGGVLLDEKYHKAKFPFVFMTYSDPFLGFFGQGIGTQLFGSQITLDRLNDVIQRSISLVGVPRVFIEQGSKVNKAANNNEIGVIVTYSGTKPSYEVAPCNAPELYAERERIINYSFQQIGVSAMQASSQKPQGLNSGAAIRSYDDISTDRFAEVSKKYDNVFIDLAYLITETAMDIAKRTGKYQTVYPNRDGTKEIDLPAMEFLKDPFVIKCYSESQLPRTPAGRMQWVTEQVQAGMLTIKEGRRLMRTPQDLEQNERLDNASEERIFKYLDEIVEDGKYNPPDIFMDATLAEQLTSQYINLYFAANLEDKKKDLLLRFWKQIQLLKAEAIPQPPMPMAPQGQIPAQQTQQPAVPTQGAA